MATPPAPASPPTARPLEGKIAIVTGGSRGLGAGMALELARRGAKVAIVYASPSSDEKANRIVSEIEEIHKRAHADKLSTTTDAAASPNAIRIRADLRDPSVPTHIISTTLSSFHTRTIHILVNNAGTTHVSPLTTLDIPRAFDPIYHLNVRAPLQLTQAILPHLPTPGGSGGGGGGRIINISSVGARCGFRDLSLYCSAKAALEGVTRCLAAELGAAGHTVNALAVGPVQSELLEGIPRELVQLQRRLTPVEHRTGRVEDVVGVVGWLASEEARWVSGQCIGVSGGFTMY